MVIILITDSYWRRADATLSCYYIIVTIITI